MARFTVRVELHNVQDAERYDVLNNAMEALGFTRTVRLRDGRRYHLPTAEYRMIGRRNREEVCRLARAGVAEAADGAAILVTEGRCSWHNLYGLPR